MQNLIHKILEEAAIDTSEVVSKNSALLYSTLFLAIISSKSREETLLKLNLKESQLTKLLSKYVRKKFPDKDPKINWNNYLLNLIDHHRCSSCGIIQDKVEFNKNVRSHTQSNSICKLCDKNNSAVYKLNNPETAILYYKNNKEKFRNYYINYYRENKAEYLARRNKYRFSRKMATPLWSQTKQIVEFYENCPKGYHVDHIVPLTNDLVCGLHVLENLQYLTATENLIKSNKYNV